MFLNWSSEHRRVSTTKHPASIMMFGVVALSGGNGPGLVGTGMSAGKHTAKTAQDRLDANMSSWPRDLLTPTVTRFQSPRLQLVGAHWGKGLHDTPQQHEWAQGFCELLMAVNEKRLRQEGLLLAYNLHKSYCPQMWPYWIVWCFWVLTYCYVTKVVYFHSKLPYCRCLKFSKQYVVGRYFVSHIYVYTYTWA